MLAHNKKFMNEFEMKNTSVRCKGSRIRPYLDASVHWPTSFGSKHLKKNSS